MHGGIKQSWAATSFIKLKICFKQPNIEVLHILMVETTEIVELLDLYPGPGYDPRYLFCISFDLFWFAAT